MLYQRIFKETERKIIDTTHSLERYTQRYSKILSKEKLDNIIDNVQKEIINEYKDKDGIYGWHSKLTGAGGVIRWRKDYKQNDNKNHSIIVSLFPLKKFHAYHDVDAKIIVENHITYWATKDLNMIDKFQEGMGQPKIIEYDQNDYPFCITFYEGKLYDLYLDGYILIN